MSETLEIIKRLDRIEKMLASVKKGSRKTWVKASVISKATGWNNEKMRQARLNGYVAYKKDGASFFYDLESIHERFLIND